MLTEGWNYTEENPYGECTYDNKVEIYLVDIDENDEDELDDDSENVDEEQQEVKYIDESTAELSH